MRLVAGAPPGVDAPGGPALDRALLLLLGGTLGTSALWGGLYDISIWGPATLFVMALTLAALASRPQRLNTTAVAILAGLAGMAALSAASALWAESVDRALIEAHRWALYAGIFLTVTLLARDWAAKRWLLGAITAGVAFVSAFVIAQMLVGDGGRLFLDFRLVEPLGYVNGQAGSFLLAFWPLVAVAETAERRTSGCAAACLAGCVASLLYMTQSRGALLALAGTALVLLATVPGRPRRLLVLVVVGSSVALVSAHLGDVYAGLSEGRVAPPEATLRAAAVAALLAGLVSGLGLAACEVVVRQGVKRLPRTLRLVRRAGPVLLAVVVTGVLLANAAGIADQVVEQVDNFRTGNEAPSERSRLLTGGGNRYDYWRVAVREFGDDPVLGRGAGNYVPRYFQLRRTSEDVRQPHSLLLQTMAELGVLGAVALLAWLGAALFGVYRTARSAASAAQRGLAVAGGGVFVGWLLHTSVDWLHLLPGLTGAAVAALATVVGPSPSRPSVVAARQKLPVVVAAVACVLLVCVGVGRLTLAAHYRTEARSSVREDPRRALELTAESLALNGEALETLYLRAAASARLGRYADARAALLEAVRLEPSNFVPHALLGDLAVRRRAFRTAQARYRRAAVLNPRDRSVGRLAQDPRAALTSRRKDAP